MSSSREVAQWRFLFVRRRFRGLWLEIMALARLTAYWSVCVCVFVEGGGGGDRISTFYSQLKTSIQVL